MNSFNRFRVATFLSTNLLCAAVVMVVAQDSASASEAGGSSLSGTWKGVFYSYPDLLSVELDVHPAGAGAVAGGLKLSRMAPPQPGVHGWGGNQTGSYQVNGVYDDWSGTYTLTPGQRIEGPGRPGPTGPLVGVVDRGSGRLAGLYQVPSNPAFFVLAPASSSEKFVAAITNSAYAGPAVLRPSDPNFRRQNLQQRLNQMKAMPPSPRNERAIQRMEKQLAALGGSVPEPGAGWQVPPPDKLLDWASRLKQEVPNLDIPTQALWVPERNLFGDAWFEPHFGMSYMAMNYEQRKAVADAFRRAPPDLRQFGFLISAFQNIGGRGQPDLSVSIYWQGVLRSWSKDLEATLAALPVETDDFTRLATVESAAAEQLPYLWPSEKNAFNTALADARTRLAAPVLTLRADHLISTAAGLPGAQELAAWDKQEKDILKYASSADRAKFQQHIDGRLDELLDQLLAPNRSALAKFGHGLDAVMAGNNWYRQISVGFGFALTRPPVQAIIHQFQSARARALEEAEPAIFGQLDAAKGEVHLKTILATELSCPGDDETKAAAAIREHANRRLAEIQHEHFMTLFSEYEKKLMVPAESGHLDLSKTDPQKHLPQPDELRLALLRGMAYGTGKVLDPHTAKVPYLLGGGSFVVRISDPRNARYAYDEAGGVWIVAYQIGIHFSLPDHDPLWDADPSIRPAIQNACDAFNATAALLSQEDNYEEFRLYDDGWGVPDMRVQGASRAGIDALLRGMAKQR